MSFLFLSNSLRAFPSLNPGKYVQERVQNFLRISEVIVLHKQEVRDIAVIRMGKAAEVLIPGVYDLLGRGTVAQPTKLFSDLYVEECSGPGDLSHSSLVNFQIEPTSIPRGTK